ncbi:MAG TPA: glycosyl hydrolase, partial [Actinomycetota bacterium]|nr:glycosyl hydrolase [Actinomycetota bacterium]
MKRVLVPLGILLSVLLLGVGAVQARSGLSRSAERQLGETLRAQSEEEEEGEAENESDEILTRAAQMSIIRTAPANEVSAAAFQAARAQAAQLPVRGGAWTEVTDIPYQNEDPRFRDPVWSNVGAGWFHVAGRITTLTTSGNAIYAGAADGGVWKSTDRGRHWQEWSQGLPRLSSGDLATNPRDGSVWLGLGESNTSFDSFEAEGVYRLARGARTWQRVGGNELLSNFVYRIRFDGAGHVYAATNRGLYRRNVGDLSSAWELVLKPDPNPSNSPYRTSHITDVITQAGTNGRTVLAVLGWRGGTLPSDERFNGFYVSNSSGDRGTFRRIAPQGDIDVDDIGRTTLARAPSGRALYAVIESPGKLAAPDALEGFSNLLGVFMSPSGNPDGPWNLIADAPELAESGSGLAPFGLFPGIQTWYNQYVLVDPHNPRHVYVGLEEVFETRNAGRTWTTPGPYWNFGLPCYNGQIRSCPMTTHPDQHGMTIAW